MDRSNRFNSVGIVHREFDGMRCHFKTHDVMHLELDVAVNEVVIEHSARFQERAILVEIGERLPE